MSVLLSPISGAEAPAERQGEAPSALYDGTLLVCFGTRAAVRANGWHRAPPQPNIPALLAESVASVNWWTDAPDGACAAGLRRCRAAVLRPDAAAVSLRASGKPLPSGMG